MSQAGLFLGTWVLVSSEITCVNIRRPGQQQPPDPGPQPGARCRPPSPSQELELWRGRWDLRCLWRPRQQPPSELGRSLRRWEADTVLGFWGTLGGGALGRGLALLLVPAGRTSRQEVSEPEQTKSPCQPGIHSPVFPPHSWFPSPSLVRPAAS